MNANHQTLHDCLAEHYSDVIANHDSVIGILYDHYAESNNADHPQIHAVLKKLREQLVTADTETIMFTVFELCTLHEECGFRGGLDMGIALAKELTSGKQHSNILQHPLGYYSKWIPAFTPGWFGIIVQTQNH